MCVICISPKGTRQPSKNEMQQMWTQNSHGAGYMCVRDNKVEIHKGFMIFDDFIRAVKSEKFTQDDVVIYHFRISTQGGVNPEMTQPFPYSRNIEDMKILDCKCDLGIIHNGVIGLTSGKSSTCYIPGYSDTALFISNYMPSLIRDNEDLLDSCTMELLQEIIGSKMAFLTSSGSFYTVGNFEEHDGLIFSNMYWHKKTELFREKDFYNQLSIFI